MGFSSKFRSSKTSSTTSSSTISSAATSPLSSRTNSTTALPELSSAPTTQSSKTSLKLTKTTSSSSSFKSMIRTISGKDNMDPLKYAPKKFKFRTADPKYVAVLGAWDMGENWGASSGRRGSWQSGVSPCASRRNSICYAEHIEEAC